MSNANVGDSTPPCQPNIDSLAKFFATVPGDVGTIVALLRELIDRLTDHQAREAMAKPPIGGEQLPPAEPVAPSPIDRQPHGMIATDQPWEEREAIVINWLVSLELNAGKLPTVREIAKRSGLNRGVLYRMDRFRAIYADRKEFYASQRRAANVRVRGPVRRGFRTAGGGVEAIDDGDE